MDKPLAEIAEKALLLHQDITNGKISHGKAAKILGISKSELIDFYAQRHISIGYGA